MALAFFPTRAVSQVKTSRSETYKDIIEKAYNLSLQKDRQQALNILANAIQKESRPQAVAELKKTASEIANIFLSDKAQQAFEIGVSLRKTDLNQAIDKLTEALRIENDNFMIVNELARLWIAKGDCKGAQDAVQRQLNLIRFDEDLKLTLSQALVCQKRWSDYQKVAESIGFKKSPQYKFWLPLEIERHLAAKSPNKAQEALATLRKLDEKYPETSYWTWKVDFEQKKSNPLAGQKYVMTCKNISVNQYRQYMIDPMLCRRLSEVEGELKGINGVSE